MKYLLLSVAFFIIFLAAPMRASAQEAIQDFSADITIRKNGTMQVKETIVYDFGQDQRHGIYRFIPSIKQNTEGKAYRLEFTKISVADMQGVQYQFTQTDKNDDIFLKIGDAKKFVTGLQTYVIQYEVSGALTYFSDHDELYWNITGNGWEIPIKKVAVSIRLPLVLSEQVTSVCYTGVAGSTAKDCLIETFADKQTVKINSLNPLAPAEGMSVAVGFPKGNVAVLEPKAVIRFFDTSVGKLAIVTILLTALWWYIILPLWLPMKWYWYGRDPSDGRMQVTAWYDPPQNAHGRKLTPSESGTLIDERVNVQELTALVVHLAQQGYLSIKEKNDHTFELMKQKDIDVKENMPEFAVSFFQKMFGGSKITTLDTAKAADAYRELQHNLYEHLVKEGFFPHNPHNVRSRYIILSVLATITFNFFLLISSSIFGRIMPKKTLRGAHAADVARGMKSFLVSQERQLAFQASEQMMFEKLLPFAVAFGVEKIWAQRFKDVNIQNPPWFLGTHPASIRTFVFNQAVQSSFATYQSTQRSSSGFSSGSGGGGSSGGGGGGGGGGSW